MLMNVTEILQDLSINDKYYVAQKFGYICHFRVKNGYITET